MKRVRAGSRAWQKAHILAAVPVAGLWAAIPLYILAPPSIAGPYLVTSLAFAAMACGFLAIFRRRIVSGALCLALAGVSAVLTLRLDMVEGQGLTLFALVYGLAMISLSQLCRTIGDTAEAAARQTNRHHAGSLQLAASANETSPAIPGEHPLQSVEPGDNQDRRTLKFLQDVFQEVKLPLATILGFAEILQSPAARDLPEAERQAYRQLLIDHCRQLISFVTDAADMARAGTSHIQLLEQEVDAADLIEVAMKSCQNAVEDCDATVVVNVIEDIELRCDAARIRRVLETLVVRAARAGGEARAVDVNLARQPDGGLEISVLDRGHSLTPDEIAGLFEPFVSQRGIEGLGLPVARQIVQLHGGKLAIAATGNGGTIAKLSLPASRVTWKMTPEFETVRAA